MNNINTIDPAISYTVVGKKQDQYGLKLEVEFSPDADYSGEELEVVVSAEVFASTNLGDTVNLLPVVAPSATKSEVK